jgi:predicted Holliday junction resolvase-like endonuclease
MIYLNVILTILCIILISFLILAIYLVKEYKNKFKKFPSQMNMDWNQKVPGDLNEMTAKLMKELFKGK